MGSALLFIVIKTLAQGELPDACGSSSGYLPSPNSCSSYIYCDWLRRPQEADCDEGQLWNVELQSCDVGKNVTCSIGLGSLLNKGTSFVNVGLSLGTIVAAVAANLFGNENGDTSDSRILPRFGFQSDEEGSGEKILFEEQKMNDVLYQPKDASYPTYIHPSKVEEETTKHLAEKGDKLENKIHQKGNSVIQAIQRKGEIVKQDIEDKERKYSDIITTKSHKASHLIQKTGQEIKKTLSDAEEAASNRINQKGRSVLQNIKQKGREVENGLEQKVESIGKFISSKQEEAIQSLQLAGQVIEIGISQNARTILYNLNSKSEELSKKLEEESDTIKNELNQQGNSFVERIYRKELLKNKEPIKVSNDHEPLVTIKQESQSLPFETNLEKQSKLPAPISANILASSWKTMPIVYKIKASSKTNTLPWTMPSWVPKNLRIPASTSLLAHQSKH